MNYSVNLIDWEKDSEHIYLDSLDRANRVYRSEGKEALLAFFEDALPFNACITNIVFRRFRRLFSEEERSRFLERVRQYAEEYLVSERPYNFYLANLTITGIYLNDLELIIRALQKNREVNVSPKGQKSFRRCCQELLNLPVFTANQQCSYILNRYLHSDFRDAEDELFNYGRIIELRETPEEIKTLFRQALEKGQYEYLYSLIKVFPTVTLAQLETAPEELIYRRSEADNVRFLRYMAFSWEMQQRSCQDEDTLALLADWYRFVRQQLDPLSQSKYLSILAFYHFNQRLALDPQHAEVILHEYSLEPIGYPALRSFVMKDAVEAAFESLMITDPRLLPDYIRTLGRNNIFAFTAERELIATSSISFEITRKALEKLLASDLGEEEIMELYMNSRLRAGYPVSLFLWCLLELNNSEDGEVRNIEALAPYEFSGFLQRDEENRLRVFSYNLRNDYTVIVAADVQGLSQKIIASYIDDHRTVRFRIISLKTDRESPGNLIINAAVRLPEETGKVYSSRQYTRLYGNEEFAGMLQKQEKSGSKLRLIFNSLMRQQLTVDNFKASLYSLRLTLRNFRYDLICQSLMLEAMRELVNDNKRFEAVVEVSELVESCFRKDSVLNEEQFRQGQQYFQTNKAEAENLLSALKKSLLPQPLIPRTCQETVLRYLLPLDEADEFYRQRHGIIYPLTISGYLEKKEDLDAENCLLHVRHCLDNDKTIAIQSRKISILKVVREGDFLSFNVIFRDRHTGYFRISRVINPDERRRDN